MCGTSGLSYRGIRGTLTHLIEAEWAWLQRFKTGGNPDAPFSEEQFPNLKSLDAFWKLHEDEMRAFLGGIDDSDLDRTLVFRNSSGKEY